MAENDEGVTLQEFLLRGKPLYESYTIALYLVAGAVTLLAEWVGIIKLAALVLLAVIAFYNYFIAKDRISANADDNWGTWFVGLSAVSVILIVGFFIEVFPPLTHRILVATAFMANAGMRYASAGDTKIPQVSISSLKVPQMNIKLSGRIFNFRNYVWAVTIAMVVYTISGMNIIAQAIRNLVGIKSDPYLIGPALLVIGLFLTRNGKKEETPVQPVKKVRKSRKPQKEGKDESEQQAS